jgi:predicted amidophosphoribosyltransferase
MIVCQSCHSENDDDSDFCDQCATALDKNAAASIWEREESPCPDCGGKVEETEPGKGVCSRCGVKLVSKETTPPPATGSASVLAGRLAEAIMVKLKAGLPLQDAIYRSCAELLPEGATMPPEGEEVECPLCGKRTREAACPGCGLAFESSPASVRCPRCEEERSGDVCECGAILSLPKLLSFVDASVLYVCSKCRKPLTRYVSPCPDCGGALLLAARLKDRAGRGT